MTAAGTLLNHPQVLRSFVPDHVFYSLKRFLLVLLRPSEFHKLAGWIDIL